MKNEKLTVIDYQLSENKILIFNFLNSLFGTKMKILGNSMKLNSIHSYLSIRNY